jgi:hypothetical protein
LLPCAAGELAAEPAEGACGLATATSSDIDPLRSGQMLRPIDVVEHAVIWRFDLYEALAKALQ